MARKGGPTGANDQGSSVHAVIQGTAFKEAALLGGVGAGRLLSPSTVAHWNGWGQMAQGGVRATERDRPWPLELSPHTAIWMFAWAMFSNKVVANYNQFVQCLSLLSSTHKDLAVLVPPAWWGLVVGGREMMHTHWT